MKKFFSTKKRAGFTLSLMMLFLFIPSIACSMNGAPFFQSLLLWAGIYVTGAIVLWGRIKLNQI